MINHLKRNCHNSRASDDTDMKLGPVTNHDIVILDQFEAILKTDFGRITFYLKKTENRTKKSPAKLSPN